MEKNRMAEDRNEAAAKEFQKVTNRVSTVTIFQNVMLSVFKLLAGILAHSNAMISDAIHSASDVVSTPSKLANVISSASNMDFTFWKNQVYPYMEYTVEKLLEGLKFTSSPSVQSPRAVIVTSASDLT